MYCLNCGNKVDASWECCPICGKQLDKLKKNIIEENYTPSDKEKKLVLIFFGCLLAPQVLNLIPALLSMYNENMASNIVFISYLGSIFYLIALILIIYAKIKYPKNKMIKIIFTVGTIMISLYLLFTIIFMITCKIALGKMS